jgi:hypothetical protein
MPGATPNRAYPYPLPTDTLNPNSASPYGIPAAIEDLAQTVDDDVTANLAPVTSMNRPIGHMRASGAQTIQPNIETSLTYNIQLRDTDNMVNTVTSPTVLTVNTAGFYMFHVLITAPVTNWTNLVLRMRLNSTTEVFVADQEFSTGAQSRFEYSAAWMHPMLAGQTMNVSVQHNGVGPVWILNRELYGMRMAT